MGHIASTDKLPGSDEQFYYQAGGYVLLRITRSKGENSFSILTATASENHPFTPPSPRRRGGVIFTNADGTPFRPKKIKDPKQAPVHPRAYPDVDKLIKTFGGIVSVDEQDLHEDRWGRPFVALRGIANAAHIRSLGNDLAAALGLEPSVEPWLYEEKQAIYEEFSVSDTGEDQYLGDGVSISAFGDLSNN